MGPRGPMPARADASGDVKGEGMEAFWKPGVMGPIASGDDLPGDCRIVWCRAA